MSELDELRESIIDSMSGEYPDDFARKRIAELERLIRLDELESHYAEKTSE